jgi:hypothetical protein
MSDFTDRFTVDQANEPIDPFDPEAMRIGALADIGVDRVMTAVPVRKPDRTEFFRVHPDWTTDTFIYEDKEDPDRTVYLVQRNMQDFFTGREIKLVRLFVAINKRGTVFLWPVRLPVGNSNFGRRWSDTALLVAEEAKTTWVRMIGERDLGGYEMYRAKGDLGTPQWPDKSFRDLIALAFRGQLIDSSDHPVIRGLAGEL